MSATLQSVLVGAGIIYANLYLKEQWNQVVSPLHMDVMFQLQAVIMYYAIPDISLDHGFTRYHFLLRLHKFFLLQYFYFGSFFANIPLLLQQVGLILAIEVVAFFTPKFLMTAIGKTPIIGVFLKDYSTKLIGSGVISLLLQQVVIKGPQNPSLFKLFSNDTVYEYVAMSAFLGVLGPLIILLTMSFQGLFGKAKQMFLPMLIITAIQWGLTAFLTLVAFQRMGDIRNLLQQAQVPQQNDQELLGSIINIIWVLINYMTLIVTPSPKQDTPKKATQKYGKNKKDQ